MHQFASISVQEYQPQQTDCQCQKVELTNCVDNDPRAERELVNSDVEALKERVAALEKIVTDKDYQLKQELEQLNTK